MLALTCRSTLTPIEFEDIMQCTMNDNGVLDFSQEPLESDPLVFHAEPLTSLSIEAAFAPLRLAPLAMTPPKPSSRSDTPPTATKKAGTLDACASASPARETKRLRAKNTAVPMRSWTNSSSNESESESTSDATAEEEIDDDLDDFKPKLKRLRTRPSNVRVRSEDKVRPKYRGIVWEEKVNSYRCKIKFHRHVWYLGLFKDPVKGARAYDYAANFILGNRARLNFPETNYNAMPPPNSCPSWLLEILKKMPEGERSQSATQYLRLIAS